ncbi:hypothetical protein L6R29_03445 [Myxococcota bacterium]|nr:hypothetical protein [Myxococcota bacterium]
MSTVQKLFPVQANNAYKGSKIALYASYPILTMLLFRSCVHFLKGDGGVNSIATIVRFDGSPDPNRVIYLFSSLWGSQQLLFVLLFVVVLVRYRNLLPLFYALLVVEVCFRLVVGFLHSLDTSFYLRTPPGKLGNLPMLILLTILLFLSLKERSISANKTVESPAK